MKVVVVNKVWMQICFIFLSVCLLQAYGKAAGTRKRIHSFAGPYTVVVHKQLHDGVHNSSMDKLWIRLYTTPLIFGKPQYVWGTAFLGVPIDDTMHVDARVSKWSNNQWKENAFVFKLPNACSTAITHSRGVIQLMAGEDVDKCPIVGVKEPRTIPNRTLNITFPKFPVFPYGRWMYSLSVMRNSRIVGFAAFDAEAVPKL